VKDVKLLFIYRIIIIIIQPFVFQKNAIRRMKRNVGGSYVTRNVPGSSREHRSCPKTQEHNCFIRAVLKSLLSSVSQSTDPETLWHACKWLSVSTNAICAELSSDQLRRCYFEFPSRCYSCISEQLRAALHKIISSDSQTERHPMLCYDGRVST